MSEASVLTEPPVKQAERSSQRRLSDAERHAIIAMWSKDGSITRVANHFNVHRNTVSDLVKLVRSVQSPANAGGSGLSEWKQKLDTGSFQAIERSVNDSQDVHKAASTGLGWLKGSGVLQPDGASVNVFVEQIMGLPEDMRSALFEVTPTPSGSIDLDASDNAETR